MKKQKGSKGKKILKKQDPVTLETAADIIAENPSEPVEPQLDSSPESEPISQLSSQTEENDRIELETGEIIKASDTFGKTHSRDPWQQAVADENTILIKRTVRSGQSIQFDGNVVILGDVNPGAEIIARGNIVVMGALRGVIHAGATGNENATVAAFRLQPTQLRIANHITRAPDGEYMAPNYPEIARIKDGVVVIELYQMGQDKQTKIC